MSFPVSITLQVHVHSDSNTDKERNCEKKDSAIGFRKTTL